MKVQLLNKAKNIVTKDVIRTFLLEDFPKPFLGELARHRVLSINAESSRARPIKKVIDQVINNPYIPEVTMNQKGMSGVKADKETTLLALDAIYNHRSDIVKLAEKLNELGIHKQDVNRYQEPFMFCSVLVTGTEWDNFYALRTADGVQPALRDFAKEMQKQDNDYKNPQLLYPGDWYTPYPNLSIDECIAKAASISYANHNKDINLDSALKLTNRLKESSHWSPFEQCSLAIEAGYQVKIINKLHQVFDIFQIRESIYACYGINLPFVDTGNFAGFLSYRRILGG